MKLLPWMFAALLAIAVVGLWTERRNLQARYATTGFNPLAPSSAVDISPEAKPLSAERGPKGTGTGKTPASRVTDRSQSPFDVELESDLLKELLAEVRGLRQDLAERSSHPRQALTPARPNEELASLTRAIERLERGQESMAKLRLPGHGFDSSIPLGNLAALYKSPLGEEALRAYNLETQQAILDEFGRPTFIEELRDGPHWHYQVGEDGEPGSWSLSVYFLQGRVSYVEVEGL